MENQVRVRKVNRVYLATVLCLILASFVIQILTFFGMKSTALMMLINQLILFIPAAVFLIRLPGSKKEALGLHRISGGNIVFAILLSYLMTPLMSFLNLLSMFITQNRISATVNDIVEQQPLLVGVIVIGVIPALVEEIILRGVLYHFAYRRLHPLKGALLCGFLFGLLHMNLNQFIYAFAMGFIFCVVVEATGSLITTMIMHGVFNATSVVLTFLSQKLSTSLDKAETAAILEQGSLDPQSMWTILPVVAILAIVFTFLGIRVLRSMARNAGRAQDLKRMFGKKEKTTWEMETTEGVPEEGESMASHSHSMFFTPPLILGILFCVTIITLTQFNLL